MKIFITGGAGLLGAALATDLIKDGRDVVIFCRKQQPGKPILHVEYYQWDEKTIPGGGDLEDGCDAIVNLASENISGGRQTSNRMNRILESRVSDFTYQYPELEPAFRTLLQGKV
jgi:uncharacterized protein